jgi:hypothetical protein
MLATCPGPRGQKIGPWPASVDRDENSSFFKLEKEKKRREKGGIIQAYLDGQ